MAEASTEDVAPPQTNGLADNEEDEKSKMRPADIDADVREMERRKRVEMIMSSKLFREELERIIESQMKEGGGPAGLIQQIQDMVGGAGRLHSGNIFKSSNCVVPINDIRGVENAGYAKGEKILRCKLSSVFRLMDLYGWNHGIQSHITARLAQEEEHFIVNPFGLMYHEVTASSLVKVDMQGGIVEPGTTNFGVNSVRFQLHAAVHAARPDLKCVIHVHTPSVLAVSSLKCGLLPLCQESAVIGEVSQHLYLGSLTEPEEKDKIARNLGPNNKVMLLSNHGAVCCGETVEEAFFNVYNTVLACETQVKLLPLGVDNLILLPDESKKVIYDAARKAPDGWGPFKSDAPLPAALEKKEKKWRVGGMEFEALMRMLDNAGFRTGYIYRTPLVKGDPPKPRNDVEVPPAVSSLGYLLEEEEMYRQGQWKKGIYSKNDRTRWLNSPNVYQKVEILETGTTDPKKITKWVDANNYEWVADGSPTHTGTPVRIDAALQFVPKNTNPKEFKKLQQQIKENRRADKITSGPQSHILEGLSWEEAKKLQDANISMTGDQVIMLGTASKGIIQRGFQHNATVYKTPYAKNPFDRVSDQEIEDYKKVINKKQKGDFYDEDQSESEALSSSAALPPSGVKSPYSETEEDSRTEPQVLRIETKTAPVASQAEVVLSDGYPVSVICSVVAIESKKEVAQVFEVPNANVSRVDTVVTRTSEMKEKFTQTVIHSKSKEEKESTCSIQQHENQMAKVIEQLPSGFSKWGKQIENRKLRGGSFVTSSPLRGNDERRIINPIIETSDQTEARVSNLAENDNSFFISSNSPSNKTYTKETSQSTMDTVIVELSSRLQAKFGDTALKNVDVQINNEVSNPNDIAAKNDSVSVKNEDVDVIEEVSLIISSSLQNRLNTAQLDNEGDFLSDDNASVGETEEDTKETVNQEPQEKLKREWTNAFIGEDYEREEDLETESLSHEMSTSFIESKYVRVIKRLNTIFEEYCEAEIPRPCRIIVNRRRVP